MRFALPMMILAALGSSPSPPAGDYIKVEIRGTLRAGVMAIGGETTGVVVTARGASLELDLAQVGGMARATPLDGKSVVVKGTLEVRRGVERRERTIVTVTSLEPAP